jgi:predicted nicotinamide N-methyase
VTINKDQSKSQEQEKFLIDYLGIKALKTNHPAVKKIKRNQSGHTAHGNKIWRSNFVLLDYLSTYPPKKDSRILDIGCGWGLTSTYLAKIFNALVTASDIDPNVEIFLSLHKSINKCDVRFEVKSFQNYTEQDLSQYDAVVSSDICFWDELVNPLLEFIKRAKYAGVKSIYLADPGRPPFWALCDQCVEAYDAQVISRRIETPWKTEKFILAINDL